MHSWRSDMDPQQHTESPSGTDASIGAPADRTATGRPSTSQEAGGFFSLGEIVDQLQLQLSEGSR